MEERGIKIEHSALNRWVINYSSSLALAAKKINVLLCYFVADG
jgi:transposase-like protein